MTTFADYLKQARAMLSTTPRVSGLYTPSSSATAQSLLNQAYAQNVLNAQQLANNQYAQGITLTTGGGGFGNQFNSVYATSPAYGGAAAYFDPRLKYGIEWYQQYEQERERASHDRMVKEG